MSLGRIRFVRGRRPEGYASQSGRESLWFDRSVPHIARVYDYWLGGKDNYPADRAVAETIIVAQPDIQVTARAQRAFLGRAVHYLAADAGIRQFLDIGTGLPAASNTHEVAQQVAPQSRVVYVDNDRCKPGCAHACWTGRGYLKRTGERERSGPTFKVHPSVLS